MDELRRICRSVFLSLLVCGACQIGLAAPYPYAFSLSPPSGLQVSSMDLSVVTEGALIGNYDAATNPTGTRTKPGLFGSFGADENVEVPTALNLGLSGEPQIGTGGGFTALIDLAAPSISIRDYSASMLAGTTASLDLGLGLSGSSFRTRDPNSIYLLLLGDIELPIGEASLTDLVLTQVAPGPTVPLTPMAAGVFEFETLLLATATLSLDALGNPVVVPPIPVPLPLRGKLMLEGEAGKITGLSPLTFSQTFSPGIDLPPFTLPVPTLLPPGETASLDFRLTLTDIQTTLDGAVATEAFGRLVPEPNGLLFTAMPWLYAYWAARRRAPKRAVR